MRTSSISYCAGLLLLAVSLCSGQSTLAGSSGRASTGVAAEVSVSGRSGQNEAGKTAQLPTDTPVITIDGLCDQPQKAETQGGCKTIVTREEFETVVAAVQPNMSSRAKPEFADQYADFLVMAKKAEELGLDKGPSFEEQMRIARIEILVRELKNKIRSEADQVSDQQIAEYYAANTAAFEEADLDRIYVPVLRDSSSSKAPGTQQSDARTKELAEQLRGRAAAGEDFAKLQEEAYEKAGMKSSPSVTLTRIRRVSLPPSHVLVMELKPGEVSAVLPGNNGYYIYRMRNKDVLSLQAAHDEIKGIVRSQRQQEETRKIEESATSTLNQSYFYPARRPEVVSQTTR